MGRVDQSGFRASQRTGVSALYTSTSQRTHVSLFLKAPPRSDSNYSILLGCSLESPRSDGNASTVVRCWWNVDWVAEYVTCSAYDQDRQEYSPYYPLAEHRALDQLHPIHSSCHNRSGMRRSHALHYDDGFCPIQVDHGLCFVLIGGVVLVYTHSGCSPFVSPYTNTHTCRPSVPVQVSSSTTRRAGYINLFHPGMGGFALSISQLSWNFDSRWLLDAYGVWIWDMNTYRRFCTHGHLVSSISLFPLIYTPSTCTYM